MNTVYGALLSPFVRKVVLTLEYKGIAYHSEPVLPFKNPESFAKISPLRKIPAFVDDYVTLADSSVICDYLEHKYPRRALYPVNPAARARALWFEEYADTALQEKLGPGLFFEKRVAPRMFKRPADEVLIRRSIEALAAHQDYLEGELGAGGFLAGPELTIADFSVPGVFLNGHYADYDVDARRWPKLAAYLQRIWALPLFQNRIEREAALLAALRR
jgi:glutathione S-transferase